LCLSSYRNLRPSSSTPLVLHPRVPPPSLPPSSPTRRSSDLAIGSRTERDAGPPPLGPGAGRAIDVWSGPACTTSCAAADRPAPRSEEHTSELQSRFDLVCRLLLPKKKKVTAR